MATIHEYEGKNGTTYKAIVRLARQPVRTKTFKTKTAAKLWAQEQEIGIRKGEIVDVNREANAHTYAELTREFRDKILPGKSPLRRQNLETCLKWWEARIGQYRLAAITPQLIDEALNDLRQEGDTRYGDSRRRTQKPKSKRTLKFYLDTVHQVCGTAVQWQWMAANPVERAGKITKIKNARTRFLSDGERKALLAECVKSANAHLYLIVLFAISTGARRGEILKLTLDDIDLSVDRAILRDTKNGETRPVPIKGVLRRELETHIERMNWFYEEEVDVKVRWLFPRADGRAPIEIKRAWEDARDAAKLEDFRFHDLRHTAASYLAREGATLLEIATVLGHKTLQMVQRYAHLTEQHTANVVERMNTNVLGDD